MRERKLGIKEFSRFIQGDLRREIRAKYLDHQVFSEADLQSLAWKNISAFLHEFDPEGSLFKVLNKPYLKGLRQHPDLVVFRRRKAWVVVELKETKQLRMKTAEKERGRLLKCGRALRAKKGYLLYVARRGDKKVLHGSKGLGARYFFEVPIVLAQDETEERIKEWEEEYRWWAKFVVPAERVASPKEP